MKTNFLERYSQMLGGEIEGFDKLSVGHYIRVNTLRITGRELVKRLAAKGVQLEKVDFLKDGFKVLNSEFSLGATPEYLFGYYYMQEAASQFPVEILKPKKSDVVLDMTAAPGGKATQIASYMDNQGVLVCTDNQNNRLIALKNNLERMGVSNAVVYKKDARFVSDLGILFDKVLLDAPCSGNFVADSKWFDNRDLLGVKLNARFQKELLKEAFNVLKPGGVLVYSTCSLEPEENEMNVNWMLSKFGDRIRLEEIDGPGSDGLNVVFGVTLNSEVSKSRRFWPHLSGTQGFFVAKFKKMN